MRAGGAGYSGGFINHYYLLPLIYPGTLTRTVQFVLAAGALAINAALYFRVYRRRTMGPTR